MALPTTRGVGLLLVAAGTYLAARMLGTWELYLLAFSFLAVLAMSWLLVSLAARRLTATRTLTPAQPKAGDKVLYSFTLRNGSLVPGLQVTLLHPAGELGGGLVDVELETLGPRGRAAGDGRPLARAARRAPPASARGRRRGPARADARAAHSRRA